MDQTQEAWLARIPGAQKLAAVEAERQEQREAILQQLHATTDRIHNRLQRDMNLVVEDEEGHEQRLLSYGVRDQTLEFDLDEQQDGYTLREEEDARKHLEAGRLVTTLTEQLDATWERPVLDENGDPVLDENQQPVTVTERLFGEEELGAQVYEPLVRRGILAETFVPDAHSRTKAMLDGSFAEYKERLEEEEVKSAFKRFFNENGAVMKEVANLTLSGVTIGVGLNKAANMKTSDIKAASLSANAGMLNSDGTVSSDGVMKAAEFTWNLVSSKIPQAVEDLSEDAPKEVRAKAYAAAKFSGYLAAGVAEPIGSAFDTWGLRASVAAVFQGKVDETKLANEMSPLEIDNGNVDRLTAVLAGGLHDSVAKVGPADPFAGAATTAHDAFVAAVDWPKVIRLVNADPPEWSQLARHYAEAAGTGVAAGLTADPRSWLDANGEDAQSTLGKAIVEDLQAELRAEKEEVEREQEALLARAKDAEFNQAAASLLQKRIAKMQRDQQTLEWAASLSTMTLEVASAFFAPMAIGGSLIKLGKQIKAAIERTNDFHTWIASRNDMLAAASPYSAAVHNFVHNAGQQAAHYTTQAAAELLNLIGAIVETAGMATGPGAAITVGVGKGMQMGAKAGAAMESLLYEAERREDLSKAWKTWRAALARPENRKLGLIAIKKNPTLAKYAVAWGAIIEKDVLVADFMTECGLNAETLSEPGAQVEEVVAYLELRMKDDLVVVGRRASDSGWEPSSIDLTAVCWAGTVTRAVKEGKLADVDTSDISAALLRTESLAKSVRAAHKPDANPAEYPDEAALAAVDAALVDAARALRAYRPQRKGSKPGLHAQMSQVRSEFADAVEAEREALAALAAPEV